MTYFAPFIDTSGLHIPTYQDIEDKLVADAKSNFGNDIYLEPDSQDFKDIAARAQTIYDTLLTSQMAYNSRSPVSAVGVGLDGVVAINGVERQSETFSTVGVTLTGTAFTVITNGVVADDNSNQWSLPASVVLDALGSASVTATAQITGPITALAGQVTTIVTPTQGWTSVTNPLAATAGRNRELDAELRARQAISVANPSQALTTGILGGVYDVANVVSAQLYENDTSAPVSTINGVEKSDNYPAHSLTLVIDGGDISDLASAIASRKTPGAYLEGNVTQTVYDQYGVPTVVRFYRPVNKNVFVELDLIAMLGYTSAVGQAIKDALVNYLNTRIAGQSIIISELWQAILSADTASYPVFSLTEVRAYIGTGSPGTTDIQLFFDERASSSVPNITVNVT